MKITKKMRKKEKGMNATTKLAYEQGYKKPTYNSATGEIAKGTTYVNPKNFNL